MLHYLLFITKFDNDFNSYHNIENLYHNIENMYHNFNTKFESNLHHYSLINISSYFIELEYLLNLNKSGNYTYHDSLNIIALCHLV